MDSGDWQCCDRRGDLSLLPSINFFLNSGYVEGLIKEDSRGIIQRWVKRKPVQVQMMKEEKVELSRIYSKKKDQNGNSLCSFNNLVFMNFTCLPPG